MLFVLMHRIRFLRHVGERKLGDRVYEWFPDRQQALESAAQARDGQQSSAWPAATRCLRIPPHAPPAPTAPPHGGRSWSAALAVPTAAAVLLSPRACDGRRRRFHRRDDGRTDAEPAASAGLRSAVTAPADGRHGTVRYAAYFPRRWGPRRRAATAAAHGPAAAAPARRGNGIGGPWRRWWW